jgi:hypothetical protein
MSCVRSSVLRQPTIAADAWTQLYLYVFTLPELGHHKMELLKAMATQRDEKLRDKRMRDFLKKNQ